MGNLAGIVRVVSDVREMVTFTDKMGARTTREKSTLVLCFSDWDKDETPRMKMTIETFTRDGINKLGANIGRDLECKFSNVEVQALEGSWDFDGNPTP